MLAAHRDQENLVHSHQVPTKQQPKTPGARYPKTPSRFGQNDENAPTAFAGKNGLGGTRPGGNDGITMTKGLGAQQGFVTPMGEPEQLFIIMTLTDSLFIEPRTRAPLGAKTTNAKARNGPTGGAKSTITEVEKTQMKQPTAHKQKPKSSLQLEIKADQQEEPDNDEEPEYAPPRPLDLPYESDLLPRGGLTFEGLKDENLFRGYYQHFINPVDEHGVSRSEKEFDDEMKAVFDKAAKRNEDDLKEIGWDLEHTPDTGKLLRQKPDSPKVAEAKMARKIRGNDSQRYPSTIRARKAASTLSVHADTQKKPVPRAEPPAPTARRPLGSLMSRQRTSRVAPPKVKNVSSTNGAEALSRTTLGYNKGKSASSMVHSRSLSQPTLSGRSTKTPTILDESDRTITTVRSRQFQSAAHVQQTDQDRPQFMSIFEQEGDDEDLPPVSCLQLSDEEEEFELSIDI